MTQAEMEKLAGAFLFPVVLTLSDGTKQTTTPMELTEEKLLLFLEDARSGKPYPVEAELGEIRTTEDIEAGNMKLSAEEINRYSPIALAVTKGKLERLQDFLAEDK